MRVEQRDLADVAASVADGIPVDWAAVERDQRTAAADRRLASHLRLVESIAALHRSIPPVDETEPESYLLRQPPAWSRASEPGRRAAADAPPGAQWGRLALLDRIGAGTSCEVYRAWDTALHREVALKLLHETGSLRDARTRLLEEARRLARLRHAHVVQVYGAEQHGDRAGLWMELVRGESLEQMVAAGGRLGAQEAALIGLDLCAALAAVHGANLLHRDVKAQNVMREHGGRIVLMDFGTGEDLSGTSRLVGTPLYLAPEIFRGQKASVQSDLYSLGVLLFHLATGTYPVRAGSMEQLANAHARRERQSLRDLRPDVAESFVRVVERALDSDPARRFQSAGEFESALRESLDGLAARPSRETPAAEVRPSRQLRFRSSFAAAAAVLLIVVSSLIVWTGRVPGLQAAAIDSLAVLPLDGEGPTPPEFADAMTAQLIATLGQIDSLQTTSLESTLSFKNSQRSGGEIARLLGVDAVLDGQLRVTDTGTAGPGQISLDVDLLAAGTGTKLWSGSFEGHRGDAAGLLARAAGALAEAVNAPVKGTEAVRLRQVRQTNPAAEEAYLQGRFHLAHYGPEAAKRALDAFRRAADLDPGHAAAHAGAALAFVRLGDANIVSHAEARASALTAIRTAAALREDVAETHAALGDLKFLYDWDWDAAEREYRRSLDLNPGFVHVRNVYAQLLAARRRFQESIALSDETLRIDPQSSAATINHGMLLYYMRDLTNAEAVGRRATAEEPDNAAGFVLLGRVLEAQGRYAEALQMMTRAWDLTKGAAANLRILVIRLQALSGDLAGAVAAERELEHASAQGITRVRPRDRAYLHLGFGRTNEALDAFEAALDARDPQLVWLTVDPRADVLRPEARFQAIVQKLGVR